MRIFGRKISRRSRIVVSGGIVAIVVFVVGSSYILTHTSSPIVLSSPLKIPASLMADAGMSTATSSVATTTQATEIASSSIPSAKPTTAAASVASTPLTSSVSPSTTNARELSSAGGKLLASLVNIVCISSNSSIPSVSGSGVIIDSRGIILTAAHVAQLFLLQDYLSTAQVQCLIRAGSPARRAYTAEPIFVSKSWITANPDTLTSSSPLGTGQYDVALLGITGTATSTPLPSSFPSVPLASSDTPLHEQVAVGSYGAQYLTSSELNYSLYPILIFGPVQNQYTFGTNTIDLISVGGSAASQEGSSGGGMVNDLGQLIGTITTSTISGSFSTRQLNAVTPFHVRSTYRKDTGTDFDATLQSESVSQLIAGFAVQSKALGATLYQYVNSK